MQIRLLFAAVFISHMLLGSLCMASLSPQQEHDHTAMHHGDCNHCAHEKTAPDTGCSDHCLSQTRSSATTSVVFCPFPDSIITYPSSDGLPPSAITVHIQERGHSPPLTVAVSTTVLRL